uniref:Ig-like domain-containing protein n=1 Tax=Naja naja TaxID=35670 RepID=A0A8C6VML5_NAJNA
VKGKSCSVSESFRPKLAGNLRITGQSVKQTSGSLTVSEGKHLSLCCSYEIHFSNTVFTYWYIQYPGRPPKLLLIGYGNVQGFHATHRAGKKNGTYNLEKDVSQLKDSFVYFCAIGDTIRSCRRGANQKQEGSVLLPTELNLL